MDYDGANVQFLTDSSAIVLAPRFSPNGDRVLYTSYESGFPRINSLDVSSVGKQQLGTAPGEMAFSPRFSRDGRRVIYSLANGGNTDLYITDLASGQHTRLARSSSISCPHPAESRGAFRSAKAAMAARFGPRVAIRLRSPTKRRGAFILG